MRTRVCALTLGLLWMLGLAPSAQAQCIICNCRASVAAPISFGNYNPLAVTDTDITGRLAFQCDALAVPTTIGISISMNAGTGSSGSFATRRMRMGTANVLDYNLYTTTARATVWGSGSGGTAVVTDSLQLPLLGTVTRNYNVFGRIPRNQNVPPGSYTDTVTVTFTF